MSITDYEISEKRSLEPKDQGWVASKKPMIKDFSYLSPSQIKLWKKSMAHWEWTYIKGHKPKVTPAKTLGYLVHSALLEPEDFRNRYCIEAKFTGTGSRKAKAEWLNDQPDDALIVSQDNADKILYMLDSVQSHPWACDILTNSRKEQFIYAYCEKLKQWFHGIVDILGRSVISDVKTTASADPDIFPRDCIKYGYHIQAALYLKMANIVGQVKYTSFPIICVENVEPYITEVYEVPEYLIQHGEHAIETATKEWQAQMKIHLKDPKSAVWPGYTGKKDITELKVPSWLLAKMEADEEAHSGE